MMDSRTLHEIIANAVHQCKREGIQDVEDYADRIIAAADICLLRNTLETIRDCASRPLYRSLEAGFRHHPLSAREVSERGAETFKAIKDDVDVLLALDIFKGLPA